MELIPAKDWDPRISAISPVSAICVGNLSGNLADTCRLFAWGKYINSTRSSRVLYNDVYIPRVPARILLAMAAISSVGELSEGIVEG